jgi:signal transduction histidine kinase
MRLATPALKNSLAVKVLGAYLVGVVLSLLLIGLGLAAMLTFDEQLLDKRAEWKAKMFAEQLEFDAAGRPVAMHISDPAIAWVFHSFRDELAYRVLDEAGGVVFDSPAGAPFWAPGGSTQDSIEKKRFFFDREGVTIHVATQAVQSGGKTWYFQFGGSVRSANLFHSEFALPFMGRGMALFGIVLFVVFGACCFVTLRRTFKPLRELSASASMISPRSLDARLPPEGVPTEVAPLVRSFNRTLERLEHEYRVQQDFLAAAAHELKTPLALIQLQVEVAEMGVDKRALLADVGHMTRQVQQLIQLAEAREVQKYQLQPVNMVSLAGNAAEYLQLMADAAGVTLDMSSSASASVWNADRGACFTLLKNLFENAVQHAPRGSVVEISVDDSRVTVRDHGHGADDDQLSKMFTRFWRGEHRRDHGAGLGLSICLEIALAHGWSLTAERAEPGLRFTLSNTGDDPQLDRAE